MLATDTPLVTVYIPTFNRSSLLKRAVDSVRNQTYRNLEIIVVDDGSTDDTLEILNELVKKDNRVKYFVNDKNSGACFSRNRAISAAQGSFITGLDDDDYFLSNRIENFLRTQKRHDDFDIFYSSYLLKVNLNDSLRRRPKPNFVIQEDLLLGNFIGNQMFCTTRILKEHLFDVNMKIFQDLDCWYRMLDGRRAMSTNQFDYVIDQSHEHERISDPSKVSKALKYLAEKYQFTNKSFILNMLGYSPIPLDVVIKNIRNESRLSIKIWVLIRALRYRLFDYVT